MNVEFAFNFMVKEGDKMQYDDGIISTVMARAEETTQAMLTIGEALKQIYARLMANERDVG